MLRKTQGLCRNISTACRRRRPQLFFLSSLIGVSTVCSIVQEVSQPGVLSSFSNTEHIIQKYLRHPKQVSTSVLGTKNRHFLNFSPSLFE